MSFDKQDTRLHWRFAPEPVCTPALLDFGELAGQEKEVRELYVYLNGPAYHYSVAYGEEIPWLRVVDIQGMSGYEAARIRIWTLENAKSLVQRRGKGKGRKRDEIKRKEARFTSCGRWVGEDGV